MTFETSALLEVELSNSSIRDARDTIEDELGGVEIGVDAGAGATGAFTREQAIPDGGFGPDDTIQAAQLEQLQDIEEKIDRLASTGGGGGGGGGSLLTGILLGRGGLAGLASGTALAAGGLAGAGMLGLAGLHQGFMSQLTPEQRRSSVNPVTAARSGAPGLGRIGSGSGMQSSGGKSVIQQFMQTLGLDTKPQSTGQSNRAKEKQRQEQQRQEVNLRFGDINVTVDDFGNWSRQVKRQVVNEINRELSRNAGSGVSVSNNAL